MVLDLHHQGSQMSLSHRETLHSSEMTVGEEGKTGLGHRMIPKQRFPQKIQQPKQQSIFLQQMDN